MERKTTDAVQRRGAGREGRDVARRMDVSKIRSGVDRTMLRVKANDRITETLANRSAEATARYHEGYDNAAYVAATAGKSTRYANNLIDAAMALCGDAGHEWPAERHWCDAAWLFLAEFAQEPRTYICAGCDVEWNRRPVGFVTFAEGRKQVLGLCRVCALGAGPDGELVAELLTYARRLAALRAKVRIEDRLGEMDAAECTFDTAAGSWGVVDHVILGGNVFRHIRRGDEHRYVQMSEGEWIEMTETAGKAEEDLRLREALRQLEHLSCVPVKGGKAEEWKGWLYGVRRGIARTEAEREAWAKHGWAAVERATRERVDPCDGCDEGVRCYTQRLDQLDCPFAMVGDENVMAQASREVAEWIQEWSANAGGWA